MILLGFDVEEFDLPFEYGKSLSFDEQLNVSTAGTLSVLTLLKATNIKATFYCTANYALARPEIILQIVEQGHELASHGYYHSDFKVEHLKTSRLALENLAGTKVSGYRMARMMPVGEQEIRQAGYQYNSSLNPTFLPGRYNNLNKPRSWFFQQGVLQIPASVSPFLRFPLFWLTFHNLPLWLIKWLAGSTHRRDGYLNLYFHPWEFTDLKQTEKFGLPSYVSRNSGETFIDRIRNFISWAQTNGYGFITTAEFAESIINNQSE